MRIIFLLFALLVSTEFVSAQTDSGNIVLKDSLPVADTPLVNDTLPLIQKDSLPVTQTDSVSRKPFTSPWKINPDLPVSLQLLQHHPYFGFGAKPVIINSDLKKFSGKEVLFYALIGLLMAFAFLRQAFPKYFNDLFRLLFRTTLKQKQIREQLMQTPLPSLLLNVFFCS